MDKLNPPQICFWFVLQLHIYRLVLVRPVGSPLLGPLLVTGGGIIPAADMKKLMDLGVGQLFPPGTETKDIVSYIKEEVEKRRKN